ncbi:GNAT family N-acetyltransferase [Candidatus Phyllobacterium onerii]|uniref:GNAT family N-acetyltransferase n=1 Tax=Candidatus Phyllobacterium onerii TaxID=3020828 RepID=UPI0023312ADD|nr:GNAT family N-acetyltransferase [Phyllobacterium sp. IY22]
MDHHDLNLRPFRFEEIETLRSIEKSARLRYAGWDGLEMVVDAPSIAAERFLSGETVVAEIDGKCVGYVLMQPLDGLMYIASIMVAADFSGSGVGAAFLDMAKSRARESKLSGVMLTTFRAPRWNGPWFRKYGFEPMPEERIGPCLRAILDRHATVLDMSKRETLWVEWA